MHAFANEEFKLLKLLLNEIKDQNLKFNEFEQFINYKDYKYI